MPAAITYLFVPGNRPERFAKALDSGADCIILDLEDAVALADKPAARAAIAQWAQDALTQESQTRARVWVRINEVASPEFALDIALLQSLFLGSDLSPQVMLPKCESVDQVATLCNGLPEGARVLPLIETARGMVALNDIAKTPNVHRLAFGALDYMVDLHIPADSPALGFAAAQIAIASRAAGLPAPLAGVTSALDSAQVTADTLAARALGFGAKMCIHPTQVAAVRQAFAPSANPWRRSRSAGSSGLSATPPSGRAGSTFRISSRTGFGSASSARGRPAWPARPTWPRPAAT